MRGYVRACLLVGLIICQTSQAYADTTGVYLPAPPRGPGGEDSIETANGTRCRQSINSNGAYLDMGVAANANDQIESSPADLLRYYPDEPSKHALIYARVTIPLGARPKRLDCSRLYEMEIIRLREELELLRMAAE